MSYMNKKMIWSIVNIAMIGILVGGIATVVVADFVKTPTPAAIGSLTTPTSIKKGMWFRYDIDKSYADLYMKPSYYSGWTFTDIPYFIVECTNVTTFGALKDPSASDAPSNKQTYQWKITPYWSNGAEAKELENGSIVNDLWINGFMQVWTGQYPMVKKTPSQTLRPWIDPSLSNYTTTQMDVYLSTQSGAIARTGGITDVKHLLMREFWWTPSTYKYNRYAEIIGLFDMDTHLLYMMLVRDIFTGTPTSGGSVSFAIVLTGYSDGAQIAGKTPPKPAPITASIDAVFGKPYTYALNILGAFDSADITMTSNNSAVILSPGTSKFTITSSVTNIPILTTDKVFVSFSIVAKRFGFVQSPVNISLALNRVPGDGKPVAVTLASVIKIGNSFNATWTASPSVNKEYWVMVNGTRIMTTQTTNVTFTPPTDGKWNVSIVVADPSKNRTSDPSNGIIVTYTVPVDEKAETNYALDPNRTDVESSNQMLFTIFMIVIVIVAAVAVLLIYLTRTGKIKITMKPSSKKVGSVGTVSKNK